MDSPPIPPVPSETFAARRAAVLERLGRGVLVLPAAPIQYASRDSERPYVPDRELYYLTGALEPDTVAVVAGGDEPGTVLFVRERDPEAELWAGARLGPEATAERLGIAECHPISELPERLPELLAGGDRLHYRLGRGGAIERMVVDALGRARVRGARHGTGPRGLVDPGELIDDLRLIKDEHEIARLREAARVTVAGHLAGVSALRPGVGEWAVQAAVDHTFRAAGANAASGPGYDTIAASGANACVLHYVDNACVVPDDSLVLLDAGAQFALYHGDVTRTYPASGRFEARQRDVYEVVDAARRAAVDAAGPGATIAAVHEAASRVIAEGLVGLGVLKGGVADLLEEGSHRPYFPHQTSHWLGLDVHDVGDYARDGSSRPLEAGMVFTIEPGLYFRASEVAAAAPFEGIGVRIEDDVLITDDGCEVLTSAMPTRAEEVEALFGR